MMENSADDREQNWGMFFALGIILMIGGGASLLAPFMASLVVETVVGAIFAIGGIVMLVQMFITDKGWHARMAFLFLGLFNTLAGVMIMFNPLEGLLALTLVVIGAVFVNGLIRIAGGIMARPDAGSGWMIAAGVLSVLASTYLLTQFPEVSVVLLGIVAGVSLIGEGAGYVRYAYGLKNNVSVAV